MPERKKIAAIVTTWFPGSHADLIASKFIAGFPTLDGLLEPRVDLVSLYIDQAHPDDVGLDLARRHEVAVYPSIRSALTLTSPSVGHWPTAPGWQDGELTVDGVLIVAEHGDYPIDGLERRHYPRRHFFEQVCAVFSASARSVPVFTDKHLSYSWDSAHWMYNRARELSIPMMAGSSLPVSARTPMLEHDPGTPIDEALSIGYHHSYPGGLESYGFHTLELLQCFVERRAGFETGVAAVQCLEDDAVLAGSAGWPVVAGTRRSSRVVYRVQERRPDGNCVPQPESLSHRVQGWIQGRVADAARTSWRVRVRGQDWR